MDPIPSTADIETLLQARPFYRERWEESLYTPFSRKLNRHVYFYNKFGYALWVLLESDPNVIRYNECVSPIAIPVAHDKAISVKPLVISVKKDDLVTVEFIRGKGELSEKEELLKSWANSRGFNVGLWTASYFLKERVHIENLKVLLRYVCSPDWIPPVELKKEILRMLNECKSITLGQLFYFLVKEDPDRVQEAVASLLIEREIYSDIKIKPFSLRTELSMYEEP